ncbi:MAG: TrkA family potassium uptake protein [candidate division Zixibacteria bacterium]|nr:TrkA family potassium uptake protein [candidate division Zixibacteria bacterium]
MAKNKFCVIGVGRFGYHCALQLFDRGNEVVAIDKSRETINRIRDNCSQAIVADIRKKELLQPLGLEEMDAVIVSVGGDISNSILVTLYLKELGVEYIVAKAVDEDHGNILSKVGADRVIYPEKDMAHKTAQVLSDPNLIDYVPLSGNYMIAEVPTPDKFKGKSIAEAQLKSKYHIQVIAHRNEKTGRSDLAPSADYTLSEGDVLTVLGSKDDIDKFKSM